MVKSKKNNMQARVCELAAPLTGRVVPLEEVADEVFSGRILGDGIAVRPVVGQLVAPADGRVGQVFETAHALTLLCDTGAELLLHIGIDTVQLGGRHFEARVKEGQRVRQGELLIRFDPDAIAAQGYDVTTPMVVSNSQKFELTPMAVGEVMEGQPLLRLTRRDGERGAAHEGV